VPSNADLESLGGDPELEGIEAETFAACERSAL